VQEAAGKRRVADGHERVSRECKLPYGFLGPSRLPVPRVVDLDRLKDASGAASAELASEEEFRDRFPDCEVGAMPPFGNLWDREVFADRRCS